MDNSLIYVNTVALCAFYNDSVLALGSLSSILYLNGVVYMETTNLNIRTHGIPFDLKMDVPQETTTDESEEG